MINPVDGSWHACMHDDMIKTGETQAALVKLVHKAKAEVSGIYTLISVGEEWRKKINLPKNCPIEVVTKLQPT